MLALISSLLSGVQLLNQILGDSADVVRLLVGHVGKVMALQDCLGSVLKREDWMLCGGDLRDLELKRYRTGEGQSLVGIWVDGPGVKTRSEQMLGVILGGQHPRRASSVKLVLFEASGP